jgi:UDP-glucose 4-epimerase
MPSRIVHAAVRGVPGPLPHPIGPEIFRDTATDLLYVEDCARGIQQVHLAPKLRHRVYNLGAGRAVTAEELASAVRRVIPGAQLALKEGSDPHRRPDAFQDIERIRAEVGYEVQHTPESATEKYVAWLRGGNAY